MRIQKTQQEHDEHIQWIEKTHAIYRHHEGNLPDYIRRGRWENPDKPETLGKYHTQITMELLQYIDQVEHDRWSMVMRNSKML